MKSAMRTVPYSCVRYEEGRPHGSGLRRGGTRGTGGGRRLGQHRLGGALCHGTGTVDKVYDEFIKQSGVTAASKAEAKEAAANQGNAFQRAIKVLSDVFVPIIPAIVASGMLMGIMGALSYMGSQGIIALDTTSVWWRIASLINACALGNLQILLGFSAATVFGGNPYLGASLGALLISSDFINAYSASTAIAEGTMVTLDVIPGIYSIDGSSRSASTR